MSFTNTDAMLRSLVSESELGMILLSREGVVLEVSRSFAETFGSHARDLVGQRSSDRFPPPSVAAFTQEHKSKSLAGQEKWIRISFSTVPFQGETLGAYLGVASDVSEERRLELQFEVLKTLETAIAIEGPLVAVVEEILKVLKDSLPVEAASYWRIEGAQIIDVIRVGEPSLIGEAAALFSESLTVSDMKRIYPSGDPADHLSSLLIPIHTQGKLSGIVELATTISPKPEATLPELIEVVARRLRAFFEQKDSEAKLVQGQGLALVGELAGSIVHEINNPLTIVYGKVCQIAGLLREENPDPKALREKIGQAKSFSEQIIEIVSSLKNLTRQGIQAAFTEVSTDKLLQDVLDISREGCRAAGIKLDLNSGPPIRIRCRPVLIQNILLNLMENAKDSLLAGQSDEKRIEIGLRSEEKSVTFYVTDNGPGVGTELGEKVFEPLVTTKAAQRGTGFGLSISRRVVEGHGGRLWYESKPGSTTFYFQLPR